MLSLEGESKGWSAREVVKAERCRRGLLFGSCEYRVEERWHVAFALLLDISVGETHCTVKDIHSVLEHSITTSPKQNLSSTSATCFFVDKHCLSTAR